MPDVTPSWHSPNRILLGPGPSSVHPRVLLAMAQPTVSHLDPRFVELMDRVMEQLRGLYGTRNALTFPVSGTGMSGMDACFSNLLEAGDRCVIGVHGFFGGRMCDVAARAGAEVTRVEAEWGRILDPAEMAEAIRRARPKLVALVHAETSTGVLQPVEEIAEAAREVGALLLLDMVTSLGAVRAEIDRWGVDAAYSATQKCVGCPSGLSPVTLSDRALAAIQARRSPPGSFYLDLGLLTHYWGSERTYHHTMPANLLFGLGEALCLIEEEGLEARFARHERNAAALRAGLEAMGLRLFADPEHRVPSLTTVCIPEGVDDVAARARVLDEFNLEIGGGLGPQKGRIWRIGLMGHASSPQNVLLVLTALRRAISAQGRPIASGMDAAAAELAGS